MQKVTFSDFIKKTMLYSDLDTFPTPGMLQCHLFCQMIVVKNGNVI